MGSTILYPSIFRRVVFLPYAHGEHTTPPAQHTRATGSRAMSTALSLQADGLRKNGRWKRGSVDKGESSFNEESSAWKFAMKHAGLVLDELP